MITAKLQHENILTATWLQLNYNMITARLQHDNS